MRRARKVSGAALVVACAAACIGYGFIPPTSAGFQDTKHGTITIHVVVPHSDSPSPSTPPAPGEHNSDKQGGRPSKTEVTPEPTSPPKSDPPKADTPSPTAPADSSSSTATTDNNEVNDEVAP